MIALTVKPHFEIRNPDIGSILVAVDEHDQLRAGWRIAGQDEEVRMRWMGTVVSSEDGQEYEAFFHSDAYAGAGINCRLHEGDLIVEVFWMEVHK